MQTATTPAAGRYLLATFKASVIRCRSGPVNGVTRFSSSTPLIIANISQNSVTRTLQNTLL